MTASIQSIRSNWTTGTLRRTLRTGGCRTMLSNAPWEYEHCSENEGHSNGRPTQRTVGRSSIKTSRLFASQNSRAKHERFIGAFLVSSLMSSSYKEEV